MNRRRAPLAAFAVALFAAGNAAAQTVSFVTCPIARETGPETDLCFYAERDGRLYGLVNPPDWGQPQLKHRVLVEGEVVAGRQACGGAALDGRVSVLPDIDLACDTVVPFDGTVVGVAGGIFNSGPPEQRARMQDLARRAEADPSLSVQPMMAPPPPTSAPDRLAIYYPFDSDRGSGPDMQALWDMVKAANARQASLSVAVGQGVSRLDDGARLAEAPGMAKRRADKLTGIVTGLGLPVSRLRLRIVERAGPEGEGWRGRLALVELAP